jgi:G3E family GTPase
MSAMVDEDVVPTDADKTPVTIITGFLGSGKTTLVNYILKEQTDWKICVIENEFGEVSIDDSLVEENMQAREDIITMDNGCVCCSVRGDLVRTLGTLVSRRKEFQAIILETTGLADPSPIVFTFNSNAAIQDNYRIDSIVCLVDAKHIDIHLDEIKPDGSVNEAEHQVAFADRILINKVDLVTAEEYEDVEDRIRSINGFASIIKTEKSRAPLDLILGLNSFSLEQVQEVDPTIMDDDPEEVDAGHVHDENCDHGHVHDENCSHDADHGAHDHGHNSHAHEHNHDKVKGSVVVGTSDDKTHGHEHDHGKAEEPHDHNHEHVLHIKHPEINVCNRVFIHRCPRRPKRGTISRLFPQWASRFMVS